MPSEVTAEAIRKFELREAILQLELDAVRSILEDLRNQMKESESCEESTETQ